MDFFTIQNLVLLILGLIVGFIIAKLIEKTAINKSIQNAKNEADNTLKSAKIEGENIKKDKIFQAKERFLELKTEHEKHNNELKNIKLNNMENKYFNITSIFFKFKLAQL